jgi:hypothetical protein
LQDGTIILTGGRDLDKHFPIGKCTLLEIETEKARSFGSLNLPRYLHNVVICRNFVYALGGFEGEGGKKVHIPTNTVEKFNLSNKTLGRLGEWESCSSMAFDRGQCFSVTCENSNNIYVFGIGV